ncbi:MAG: DedA family protein [Acidimicrobiales bacterium]
MIIGGLAPVAATGELSGVAGWMASLIDTLGPVGVGLIVLLETVFPPIPSEVVLPAAGYLAGLGELSFWATLVSVTVGSVAGALVLYWAGATVGADRLAAITARIPLVSHHDVDRAWRAFERWQQPVVFWGRLVPGVRSLVSIPAGAQRMPLVRFVGLTAGGSLVWNATLMTAGWWLGDRYGATAAISRWLNLALLIAVTALVGWFTIRRVRHQRPSG